MRLVAIANRTPEHGERAFREAGIEQNRAEQVRVDAEGGEVHEGQRQPLGERHRLGLLFGPRGEADRVRDRLAIHLLGHQSLTI